jgi:hypothetical protein
MRLAHRRDYLVYGGPDYLRCPLGIHFCSVVPYRVDV